MRKAARHFAVRPSGAALRVRSAAFAVAALIAAAGAAAMAQTAGIAGGTFELIDQNGKRFDSRALAGSPYAIFFGFTNCPDVCPTTLQEMTNNLAALGADADRLMVVFVTIDPERDTVDLLRRYLASFDARIVGLTGTPEQIAVAAKGWNAFYHKLPESDGSYTMVHSAYVYLMDRSNHLVGTMGFQEPEAEQVAKLRKLIGGPPR